MPKHGGFAGLPPDESSGQKVHANGQPCSPLDDSIYSPSCEIGQSSAQAASVTVFAPATGQIPPETAPPGLVDAQRNEASASMPSPNTAALDQEPDNTCEINSAQEEKHESVSASTLKQDEEIPPPPTDAELIQLRSLLMQHEVVLLEQLRQRMENPLEHAKDISNIIAEALVLRTSKDAALNKALEPSVESIIKVFLRKRPQEVTALLFPVIGATIRRSITETFSSMMESFGRNLEHSFSLRGLRWRLEALRTNKSFSEVVVLHTLLYRVEQAFFIHGETGIVLAHAQADGVASQDADMVSAMLTAIQDFVRDCFLQNSEDQLDVLRLGEFTIYVERAPQAYIACVVRGTPPADFRESMRTALELMCIACADAFAEFNGDNEPFLPALRYLQDLLIAKEVTEAEPLPLWLKWTSYLILLAVPLLTGWYIYSNHTSRLYREALDQQKYMETIAAMATLTAMDSVPLVWREQGVKALQAEPGFIILEVHRTADETPWHIICLRDNLARQPQTVLEEAKAPLSAYTLETTPFLSYQPQLMERRIMEKLAPPVSVEASLSPDGTLHLAGTAPLGWILQARQTALSQPGISAVDISRLWDPRTAQLMELREAVEGVVIYFPLGQAKPTGDELVKLEEVCDTLAALQRLSKEMGMALSLTVYGHADATGRDDRNYQISQDRARTLAAMLYARGSSIPLTLYGMGADHADLSKTTGDGDETSRKIELRTHLNIAAEADFNVFETRAE